MPHAAGLWYEIHGSESAEPLVLSSGLGGSGSYWDPNLSALAEHYRVITYDHRGTGRSERDPDAPVNVESMAKDVAALLDHLGIANAHFIGHALGGLVGLELALDQMRTRKLVIVNGWSALDPHTARCFDARLALLRHEGAEAYVRAQPIFLYPAGWIHEHATEVEIEISHQLSHFPGTVTIEKRIAAARDFHPWFDMAFGVLALAAADDVLVPWQRSRLLAESLCDARFERMDWGGHACNVTDPETFNRIVLDFLRS